MCAIDTVPDHVRNAAYDAVSRREVGIPVAEITFDSVMEEGGTREPGRRIRFEAPECAVEIVVSVDSGRLAWAVTLTPPREYDLVLRKDRGQSRQVATDAQGRVHVPRAPRGILSVLVSAAGGQAPIARTAWVPL